MAPLVQKKKILYLVSVIFLTVMANHLFAQSNVFSSYKPIRKNQTGKFYFQFEGTSFFQNNEYFSPFAYGYTGIGFFAKPSITYTFSKRFKMYGGIYLLKFSGLDHFSQSIPFFSVQYKISKSLELVMGNIYGTANHHLEEPLFRVDRYYRNHLESGLQFLWHSKHFQSDLWLNWENFIWFGDKAQEQLTVGSSSRLILYQHKKLSIFIPIQLLVKHKGGQLAPGPHPTLTTVVNSLSGLNVRFKINKTSSVQFSQYMAFYEGISHPTYGEDGYLPYDEGWGSYTKLILHWKHFHFQAAYWYGHQFIAPLGETQFQSVSEINPDFIRENRKLITPRIWYSRSIAKGVKLQAGSNGYYDCTSHQFDYSYDLYIHINTDFFLKKVHRK